NVSTYTIAPGGLITYGAVDTQNCDAHIDYVPLTPTARWQFQWDGFAVGKSNFPGHQQVITDTGISYLHLLTPHFDAFMKEIGADYQFAYGIFTVDCDAKNLPDIVLTIGGKKYNIPSSEYVLDVDMGENQCTVAANDIGATSSMDQPTIVLGNLFHRTYCHVYDIGQKRIGFAKSRSKQI
ncbi:aspartic protease, partial [Aphelenchoides avenae]